MILSLYELIALTDVIKASVQLYSLTTYCP